MRAGWGSGGIWDALGWSEMKGGIKRKDNAMQNIVSANQKEE